MDLEYSAQEQAFRAEVREFLQQQLPDDLRQKVINHTRLSKDHYLRWHKIMATQGWVGLRPVGPKSMAVRI